jgi:hypothetical protein
LFQQFKYEEIAGGVTTPRGFSAAGVNGVLMVSKVLKKEKGLTTKKEITGKLLFLYRFLKMYAIMDK